MGQVPMAAALDDLFPPIFRRISSQGVPAFGIIISAIFATLLVLSQVAGPKPSTISSLASARQLSFPTHSARWRPG